MKMRIILLVVLILCMGTLKNALCSSNYYINKFLKKEGSDEDLEKNRFIFNAERFTRYC